MRIPPPLRSSRISPDDRSVTLEDLADLMGAAWNRSNMGALISLAQAISAPHPKFLEMVRRMRFRGLFAKSWAVAFPELPSSISSSPALS
jgi:hypothetical protein